MHASTQADLRALKDQIDNVPTEGSGGGRIAKHIAEYKLWDNLEKLDNDGAVFRGWKLRMKEILRTCSK